VKDGADEGRRRQTIYEERPSTRKDHLWGKTICKEEGMTTALETSKAQRKCHSEQWIDANSFDAVEFPATGDVGRDNPETMVASARHGNILMTVVQSGT
jgi:hypothetical protein